MKRFSSLAYISGVLTFVLGVPAYGAPQNALRLPDAELSNSLGQRATLASLRGKSATVVAFLSTECPISNTYIPTLNRLAKENAPRGVSFVWLNPNDGQTLTVIKTHRKDFQIERPVYKDAGARIASSLGVTACPTVCVFDKEGKHRYVGRIDDRFTRRGGVARPVREQDLQKAIDQVLDGSLKELRRTEIVGCPIATKPTGAATNASVTYSRHIAPLLQKHCQDCHHENGVAPFALTTYEQAAAWASDVLAFTADGRMPPWKPVAGIGDFKDARRLSNEEKDLLARWVKEGCAEGDRKDLPAPKVFNDSWVAGKPPVVLDPGADYHLGPEGPDVYRNFVFKLDRDKDVYVDGYEILPSNRRIVHHVLLFIDSSGRGARLDARDPGPGYEFANASSAGLPGFVPDVMLGGWAPGNSRHRVGHKTMIVVPKGHDLIMQVHYSRTGKAEKDRTRVGLYVSKEPPKRAFGVLPIEPMSGRIGLFLIPKDNSDYRVRASATLPEDVYAYTVTPHMHLLGKEMKVTATLPDGKPLPLVHVRDWDFNWQETYFFREPILLPAGTRLDLEAAFDNSEGNVNNPHRPPRTVRYGEQTSEEMCICFLGCARAKEATSFADLRAPSLDQLFFSEVRRIQASVLPRGRK